jgi:hypothetical protein
MATGQIKYTPARRRPGAPSLALSPAPAVGVSLHGRTKAIGIDRRRSASDSDDCPCPSARTGAPESAAAAATAAGRSRRSLYSRIRVIVTDNVDRRDSIEMSGKEYNMRVSLKVKHLLDCPLEGRVINVQLHWGAKAMWGGHKDMTGSEPCINRKVTWDGTKLYEHECKVYLEPKMPSDGISRDRLYKRQPSSAHLRISVNSPGTFP